MQIQMLKFYATTCRKLNQTGRSSWMHTLPVAHCVELSMFPITYKSNSNAAFQLHTKQ